MADGLYNFTTYISPLMSVTFDWKPVWYVRKGPLLVQYPFIWIKTSIFFLSDGSWELALQCRELLRRCFRANPVRHQTETTDNITVLHRTSHQLPLQNHIRTVTILIMNRKLIVKHFAPNSTFRTFYYT